MYVYPYGDSQQLNLDWIINKLKELEDQETSAADLEEIANVFIALTHSSGTQYRRYDYCYYQGKLYRALNDNIGPFNASDWMEVRLGDDIPIITRLINAIDASAVFDVKFDTSGTNGKLQQKYNNAYHDVVEVDYTPVQNSKRPLSSNAGYDLKGAITDVSKHNFILLGDSFGSGVNGNDHNNPTNGWYKQFKTAMNGFPSNIYYHTTYTAGVSGFASSLPFLTMLQDIETANSFNSAKKASITDVVVLGGTNDISATLANIEPAISAFMTYVKANYPNAKVKIGCLGTDIENLYSTVYPRYKTCVKYGAKFIESSLNLLCDPQYIGTDGTHLTPSGYNFYCPYINNIILDGETSYQFVIDKTLDFSNMSNVANNTGESIVARFLITENNTYIRLNTQSYAPVALDLTSAGMSQGSYQGVLLNTAELSIPRIRELGGSFGEVKIVAIDGNNMTHFVRQGGIFLNRVSSVIRLTVYLTATYGQAVSNYPSAKVLYPIVFNEIH